MGQHAIAAALEALAGDAARVQAGNLRLGIVVCLLTGVVGYSRRFFEEVLRNPAAASPVLFPETVFNAPASHLAAYLEAKTINYTLVGDEGTFLQGLALATQWLATDQVDGCVVVGAEELDWLVPDAMEILSRGTIHGSGAGAVYLDRNPNGAIAELLAITDAFSLAKSQPRARAAQRMRAQLPASHTGELLCLSTRQQTAYDTAENSAWADWSGGVLAPKSILGEAFVAAAAWQCVLAISALADHTVVAANVSVVGSSQQAIGARFGPAPLVSAKIPQASSTTGN